MFLFWYFQSRKIDSDLNDEQIKLKKQLAQYKRMVERFTDFFSKKSKKQNGTDLAT